MGGGNNKCLDSYLGKNDKIVHTYKICVRNGFRNTVRCINYILSPNVVVITYLLASLSLFARLRSARVDSIIQANEESVGALCGGSSIVLFQ